MSPSGQFPCKPNRRQILQLLGGGGAAMLLPHCTSTQSGRTMQVGLSKPRLPWSTVFKGEQKFNLLCKEAKRRNWASLPIGKRTVTIGKALVGTPYINYTLEIDDKVESPCVNFLGLDCWTFYETSLAFSRMIKNPSSVWSKQAMLHYVELERYRNGQCTGSYLSRMHHLEEVFADNEKRGLGVNETRSLGGVPVHRDVKEMQCAWRQYRYLRANPSLVPQMARVEANVSSLPVTYIPSYRVAGIESRIEDGDVIAIASRDPGGYTSHVGLAARHGSNCHFMHATSVESKGRCCYLDDRISVYLGQKGSNMGIVVFRPNEAPLLA